MPNPVGPLHSPGEIAYDPAYAGDYWQDDDSTSPLYPVSAARMASITDQLRGATARIEQEILERQLETGVWQTDVGTSDDSAAFLAARAEASAKKAAHLLPANAVVTLPLYTIPDGDWIDLAAPFGMATLQQQPGQVNALLDRRTGTPTLPFFRARGVIFQGTGDEGTQQTITDAAWNGAGDNGSWIEIPNVLPYVAPGTGYPHPSPTPQITAYKYLAGPNISPKLTYTTRDFTPGHNRLRGLNVNPLTLGKAPDGSPESIVGYMVDQGRNRKPFAIYNCDFVDVQFCWFFDFWGGGPTAWNGRIRRICNNRIERVQQAPYGANVIVAGVDAQHPPSDGPINVEAVWVDDNFIRDASQAGIVAHVNGPANDATPRRCSVRRNNIGRIKNFAGVDLETKPDVEGAVQDNLIFSTVGGINCTLGGSPNAQTPVAQSVSSGGSLLVPSTSNWLPSGMLRVVFADARETLLAYTSLDATHFIGVTPAIKLYGTETVYQFNERKKLLVTDNYVDDETWPVPLEDFDDPDSYGPKAGIRVAGGDFIVADNEVAYRGRDDAIRCVAPTNEMAEGGQIRGNLVKLKSADPTIVPVGIHAAWLTSLDVTDNQVIRESRDPATSGMSDAIVLASCRSFSVEGNRLTRAGRHAVLLSKCVDGEVKRNKALDAGSQGGVPVAVVKVESDCWDIDIDDNRGRWSGSGYQYDRGVWVDQGGGGRIKIGDLNDFDGYSDVAYKDGQNASTTISGAQTVAAGGNVKLASLSNIPKSGGRAKIGTDPNAVQQSYRAALATVTAHVNGAQTISSGQDLTVSSIYNLLDQGNAVTILNSLGASVSVSWASRIVTGGGGTEKLVNCAFAGGPFTFPDGAAITVTNVLVGLSVGGTYAGGETVAITSSLVGATQKIDGAWTLTDRDRRVITTTGTKKLPSAVGRQDKVFWVKNAHASDTITVNTTGGQTIDGDSTVTLTPNAAASFVSDGANWFILSA